MKTLLALSMACALVAGCSDDGGKTTDKGITVPDGTTTPDGPVTTTADGPITKLDGPVATGQNSGKTCTADPTCTVTGDDCLGITGWTSGMCFAKCSTQGDVCPTADNTKYLSLCALSNQAQTEFHCLYICELQAKTYECPEPATQECVDSTTAGVKICKPKGAAPDAGM